MSNEYISELPEVQELSAPSPLRSELIAAFNAVIRRIEAIERELDDLWREGSQ